MTGDYESLQALGMRMEQQEACRITFSKYVGTWVVTYAEGMNYRLLPQPVRGVGLTPAEAIREVLAQL